MLLTKRIARTRYAFGVALLAGMLSAPAGSVLAAEQDGDSTSETPVSSRDLWLGGAGLALTGVGYLSTPASGPTPAEGLDRREIAWGFDRASLDFPQPDARTASDVALLVTAAQPGLWTLATRGDARGAAAWQTGLRQTEASLLAMGASLLLKSATARPRPFNYYADDALPDNAAYDRTTEEARSSFPSGHAGLAWASTVIGISERVRSPRPLSPTAHFLAGMGSGATATATALLRIDGGMHFPSDVAAGAGVGCAAGVLVSWVHGGGETHGLLEELAGVAAGVGLALLFTPPTSPWVN